MIEHFIFGLRKTSGIFLQVLRVEENNLDRRISRWYWTTLRTVKIFQENYCGCETLTSKIRKVPRLLHLLVTRLHYQCYQMMAWYNASIEKRLRLVIASQCCRKKL